MKIKIKALSLALLSIAWVSQAQAQWSVSGTSGCPGTNNGDICTINSASGPLSGTGNLTITSNGSVTTNSSNNGNAINASGTFSITNSGSISAPNATHGIKVSGSNNGYSGTIINNSGANISGKWNGVSVETGSGSGTIAITNSGNISGVSGKGIYLNAPSITATINNTGNITGAEADGHAGIYIQSAASGTTLENSGNVSGRIGIVSNTAVNSIKLTSGLVSGSFRGLDINGGGTIDSIEIGQSAHIYAPSEAGSSSNYQAYARGAIFINGSTIKNFNNAGTIEGAVGILLYNQGVKVENLTNSGTIKSTSPDQTWTAAVTLIHFHNPADIGTFTNESGGRIEADAGHGLSMEFGTNIDKFINKGTIEVGGDGFNTFWGGGGSGDIKIGSIDLESASSIKAGNIALNITLPSGNHVYLGTIQLASGARIESLNGPAINLGSTTEVTGSGANNGAYITLEGTLKSTDSAFVNSGLIGASGHSGTVISVGTDVAFEGSDKTNIVNKGTINGDIEFTNTQNATFANLGTFNGKLIVKGTGTVTIEDWAMNVVPTDDGQGAKVESVHIDDSAAPGKVIVDHVSINDISSSLMGKDIDFSNAFVAQDGTEIKLKDDPTAVTIGSVPSSLGFDGTYDAQTNKFYTSFNIAQTAGAVVSQTLANQLMRRDFFLESAVTEAATGSLYHRKLDGVEGTAFVKPYASSDTFDLKGAKMDGTTQGVMLGINRFVGRHLLTGYVGFERSEIDSDFRSSTMNLDVQSWYGGFNTAHLLQSNSWVDTFLKGSLKASYTTTGIDRQILLNANTTNTDNVVGSNASVIQSSAKPNTVAVGMNVQMGMNFKPMKETQIIPMVGLGYSIGKTSSYQLDRTGLINDSYMPERVMMPYADASVTWFQGWGKIVRTFVGGGMRYILDRTQKTALSYGKLPIEGEYSLPQSFQYVNASMVLHITHHSEIALGYTGVFDSTGHSQNLTTKYELHF